jgi:hypothetical protein
MSQSSSSCSGNCNARESSYSVGYSIKASGEFVGLFKTALQHEQTWTWTHGFETCKSEGTSQSAEIGLVPPSSEYSGPTLLGVAYDTFFQTFAFTPAGPGGRVAVAGTVRDNSGRPVPGLEVLLYANGITHRTFTDEQGLYEFSGDFVGPMEVATRGVPKQSVPQAEGIAIVDLIRPVEIPLPLQPTPWVPQPPAGRLLASDNSVQAANSPAESFTPCFTPGPCPVAKTVTFTLPEPTEVFIRYDLGQSHGCCDDHVVGLSRILLAGTEVHRDSIPFFNYGVAPISEFLEDFDYFFPPDVVMGLTPPVSQLDPTRVGPPLQNYKLVDRFSLGSLAAGSYTVELQLGDAGWNSIFDIYILSQ